MRLLTHQFIGRRKGGFALTYSTLASIIKYPYSSVYAGKKGKFGFFQSEEEDYLRIADELGICRNPEDANKFVRYPLVYLVEAADDICYQIMDIEDACKLHILTTEEAIRLLLNFFEGERLDHIVRVMKMVDDTNEQIAYLRSCIIGLLVDECSRIFLENEEDILSGTYNTPLIDNICDQAKAAYDTCSKTAYKKIYRAKEVLDIELAGYHIFSHLIDTLTEAVMNQDHAYSKLLLQRNPGTVRHKRTDRLRQSTMRPRLYLRHDRCICIGFIPQDHRDELAGSLIFFPILALLFIIKNAQVALYRDSLI